MNNQTFKSCFAIGGIVILEALAIISGIDGHYFGIAIAAVAGIGGFALAKIGGKK